MQEQIGINGSLETRSDKATDRKIPRKTDKCIRNGRENQSILDKHCYRGWLRGQQD